MTSEDFIVNVKTKYGNQRTRDGRLISDLEDKELLTKMLERYPGERENIEDLDSYLGEEVQDLPEVPKTDVQEQLDKVKKSFTERIGERFTQTGQEEQQIRESSDNPLSKFIQSAGAGARLIGGVAEEAVTSIPVIGGAVEKVGEKVGEGIQKGVVEPLSETPLIKGAAEGYNLAEEGKVEKGFEQVAPELLRDVSAAGDVANIVIGAKSIKPTIQAVKTVGQKTAPIIDKATEGMRQAQIAKQRAEVDDAVGRIIQGTPEDISKAKSALSNVDSQGIKTYEELNTRINEKVGTISKKLEEYLDENAPNPLKSSELANRIEVNGKTVFQTPVQDALSELSDYYAKINDVVSAEKMRQISEKLNTEGLTLKEVNDIAKLHGRDLNAFNANGELASGLSKQAAENTRKALKTVVRDRLPGDIAKELDRQMSDLLQTSNLTKKMEDKVNALYQKVKKRGLFEKIARSGADVANTLTLNTVSGFLGRFFPSQIGLKQMNSLDIEAELAKNLKKVQKLSEIEDPKKFSEALSQYMEEVQPGMSIRSTVRPDSVAKKIDAEDRRNIVKIIDNPDLRYAYEDMLQGMGLAKATDEELVRFLKDVIDEYDGVTRKVNSFNQGEIPSQLNNPVVNQKTGETLNEAVAKLQKFGWQEKDIESYKKSILNPEKEQKVEASSSKPDYGMSHRPTETGATADDITLNGEFIPKDFYEHPEWYAQLSEKSDRESWQALLKVKGKPDAEITIYRASPKNELNNGDWVTLSKTYAQGESKLEGTPVNSFKVKAKDIQFAGDSINEFGYYPNRQ